MPDTGSLQTQDPDEVITWEFDWNVTGDSWLGADTISSATVTADTGITIDSQSFDNTSVYVTLSGGTVGERYKINCHVVSSSGQEGDKSFWLMIEEE